MAPRFGTSGLRGLVSELTDGLVADHVRAFVATCDVGGRVLVGHDLRPSSPHIASVVALALRDAGLDSVALGALSTPALALAAQGADAGAIMVTGSHIPADRNGLKFYTRDGEISKDDEAAIAAALGRPAVERERGAELSDPDAAARFVARYVGAFGSDALAGRRIGVYAHSAVGSADLAQTLRALGAEVIVLAPSETFVPVDTEAVDRATRETFRGWARTHSLDAIVSTDGDSDRPMLTDETGRVVPGDVLGQITAQTLGADTVVTPVSSNTGVMQKGFGRVVATRIGSPHVIAAMAQAGGRVLGYEANGGTLLGFEAAGPAGPLAPLPTRDSFLPILSVLAAAAGGAVSERVAREPARFTAADRLTGVAPDRSAAFLARLEADADARAALLSFHGGQEVGTDRTDGLRVRFDDGAFVHLRPSGNAPEFRLYTEAETPERAASLLSDGLARVSDALGSGAGN